MPCVLKSDIKLLSNIIRHDEATKIGYYLPIELKPREYLDVRLVDTLSNAQRKQVMKNMFHAEEVRDTDVRFSDLPENKEMCKDCPYRDICY